MALVCWTVLTVVEVKPWLPSCACSACCLAGRAKRDRCDPKKISAIKLLSVQWQAHRPIGGPRSEPRSSTSHFAKASARNNLPSTLLSCIRYFGFCLSCNCKNAIVTWPDRREEANLANLAINAGAKSVCAPPAPPKVFFWLCHGLRFDPINLVVMGAVMSCGRLWCSARLPEVLLMLLFGSQVVPGDMRSWTAPKKADAHS